MGHSTTQLGMGPVTSFSRFGADKMRQRAIFKPSMLFDLGAAEHSTFPVDVWFFA